MDLGGAVQPTNQALPWILIEESQHHVESGSSPAFQAVGLAVCVASLPCNGLQVPSSHTGRQEGLLPVAPGAVGNERASVRSHAPGKLTRAVLKQHTAPSQATGLGRVNRLARLGVEQGWDVDVPGQGRRFLNTFEFYTSTRLRKR